MGRTIATSTPTASVWGSVETALRLTISTLRASARGDATLATLEAEQNRLRQTARHWLMG